MTSKTKDQIKVFFETGKQPTEAQFIDFIDSYVDRSGPIGSLEAAASAGTNGIAFVSGNDCEVYGASETRNFMGITIYTTALAISVIGQNFTTTAAALAAGIGVYTTSAEASSVASDAINSRIATTAQATAATNGSLLMTPILTKKIVEDNALTSNNFATTAQATNGTDATTLMNPVLTKNAIASLTTVPTGFWDIGTDIIARKDTIGTLSAGATISGTGLSATKFTSGGSLSAGSTIGSGTWRNMSTDLSSGEYGVFRRVS